VFFRRESRVEAGGPKEIECCDGLGQDAIPQVKGKPFVSGAEARDTMVFERLDGSFCCISLVYVWQDQLIVDAFFSNESFEGFGCFVVELLELRLESAFNEILV
jgi:hypothetical protein